VLVDAGEATERLTIVRLDPATVRFRVRYAPGAPLPLSGWAARLQSALIVNGGYFTPENETAGLLISGGQAWGTPYGDFAGMFAVSLSTPSVNFAHPEAEATPHTAEPGEEERASVRWLHTQPYDPAEPIKEAVQSFPVLIKPGGVMGFPADADDGRPARRTVVAQDLQGRILFIVAPRGHLSLHALARSLAESDLGLDVALNLDGGFSTGLWLQTEEKAVKIDSLVPVPSIISVEDRYD
jgi:hypothetical protein